MEEYDKGAVTDLTLVLLYLTGWREGKRADAPVRSWRSYDWGAIDFLHERGLIFGSLKNKSVYLTDEGEKAARLVLAALAETKLPSLDDLLGPRHGGSIEAVPRKAFRLRVELDFEELACWREIVVPADYTFYDLHFVLQALIGRLDYHLYDFRYVKDGEGRRLEERCEESDFSSDFSSEGVQVLDVESVVLSDVYPSVKRVIYSYDYGDGWEVLVDLIEALEDYTSCDPMCAQGQGDAPPDDVGGEGGFKRFLEALADKAHPEHQRMREWGKGQGFERFDLRRANELLSEWRGHQKIHDRNKNEVIR